METIYTDQQKNRNKRNDSILEEFNKSFKGGSKTQWAKIQAKKLKVSFSTVYNLLPKKSREDNK